MSDNVEMFDVIGREEKLIEVFFNSGYFSKEEADTFMARSHNNVFSGIDKIKDDLDLAMLITDGGLVYRDENAVYNLGITQALLSKEVELTYGVKSWFMERDQGKQPTLYEYFTNQYFISMFGDRGYRQLFSGDSKSFIEDFKKYGGTEEELLDLDRAINNSVFLGEYNRNDNEKATELCNKITKGRKEYESSSIEKTDSKKMNL